MPTIQKIPSVYRTATLQNSDSQSRHQYDKFDRVAPVKKSKLFKDILRDELSKK